MRTAKFDVMNGASPSCYRLLSLLVLLFLTTAQAAEDSSSMLPIAQTDYMTITTTSTTAVEANPSSSEKAASAIAAASIDDAASSRAPTTTDILAPSTSHSRPPARHLRLSSPWAGSKAPPLWGDVAGASPTKDITPTTTTTTTSNDETPQHTMPSGLRHLRTSSPWSTGTKVPPLVPPLKAAFRSAWDALTRVAGRFS